MAFYMVIDIHFLLNIEKHTPSVQNGLILSLTLHAKAIWEFNDAHHSHTEKKMFGSLCVST